jgi:acetolactate synthase-1/2/3 large subunit
MNAARDHIPIIMMAGRSPLFEAGSVGSRNAPIHWSQELFDQAAMVRELVKWDYELRDGRHVDEVIDRAVTIAMTPPRGPVYLSLPREVLASLAPAAPNSRRAAEPGRPSAPSADAVALLADRLAEATMPVISVTATGADESTPALLADICDRYAIGVVDCRGRYLNVAADHPLHLGYMVEPILADVDVLCCVESEVPWIDALGRPADTAFVAQCGIDPLSVRVPIRSHRSDLTVVADSKALLVAVSGALAERAERIPVDRRRRVRAKADELRRFASAAATSAAPEEAVRAANKTDVSLELRRLLPEDAAVFTEYWIDRSTFAATRAGTYFDLPLAGGLGWAVPAAIGFAQAVRNREAVAVVGDGAYLFANPVSSHHAAALHQVPFLTVVCNNSRWAAVDRAVVAVYPDAAVDYKGSRLSCLGASPDFEQIIAACGGHGEVVEERSELAGALARAQAVVAAGGQALVDVRCPEGPHQGRVPDRWREGR